ncbi:MAG: PEGA domain-containing protein, partial [Calditrichaeota bacterium]
YIDGTDLEKIIRRLRRQRRLIPPHLAVHIVAETCMALDYAHQRRDAFTNKPLNLVHQDISPSNIMISRFGAVKLIDFGIASVKRHHKEKRDNKLRGKIPYMAPEQLLMGNHPDHRSDLFSLGLVLYEALTGHRLFHSQEELIAAGKNAKWLRKVLRGTKMPAQLGRILNRALEIDLSRRYQSANHMYIDLLQYLISCNETGELMEQLAEFVGPHIPPTTPTHSITAPVSTTPQTTADGSVPYLSTPSGTNHRVESAPLLQDAPDPVEPQPIPEPPDPPVRTQNFFTSELDEFDDEDDVKTVIDVLRISARNHKRRLLQGSVAVLTALLAFGILDTLQGWTPAGRWLSDRLFPPAIKITTVPPGAKLKLDGDPVPGETPVAIAKIAPGVHKLEVSLAGYKPIVKSLFVPRKGGIRIQGTNGNARTYIFRFSTDIAVTSQPPQATVYINGVRFNHPTPCSFSWEVGAPLALELEHAGFEKLSGFSLDTAEGFDQVDDRRFWQLTVLKDGYTHYAVKGLFRKKVYFETTPSSVAIVDVKTDQTIGYSDATDGIYLTAGKHELELRKDNFIPRRLTVTIDKKSPERIKAVLSRRVRFGAIDELAVNQNDVHAQVVSLKIGNREYLRNARTTPFELQLPAYSFTAVFAKDGYQNTEVKFGPRARSVQAEMERAKSILDINVLDGITGLPVAGAEIYINLVDSPQTGDTFFDQTGANGQGFGEVPPGRYLFKVSKTGYNKIERVVITQAGETSSLTFKLYPSN